MNLLLAYYIKVVMVVHYLVTKRTNLKVVISCNLTIIIELLVMS